MSISTPKLDKAEEYWSKTASYWKTVRSTWAAVEASPKPFTVRKVVDDKPMYSYMFSFAEQLEEGSLDTAGASIEGMATIGSFLEPAAEGGESY